MRTDPRDCDRSRLARLLDDGLNAEEATALDRHLEGCEPCRRALEMLAASEDWWAELPNLVANGPGPGSVAGFPPGFLDPTGAPGRIGRLGPYEILGVLGRGGMGVVLRGFDPALGRPVAIKVLSPHLAASASARLRFAREARAAAAVSHEHVVAIHAVDAWKGLPYLVMPSIRGLSLQERIERDGPLPPEEALRIVLEAARGLAAAHARGLVHRDIKPANILLEEGTGRVKITDFGLARTADDASLTLHGVLAGTPAYMAPEAVNGEPVDARSDLFSLGSVLYAICAGHPPFRAPTTMAVLRQVGEASPRPIREVNPATPEGLATLIAALQERDPSARPGSAAELAEAIEAQLSAPRKPGARARPRRLRLAVAATALLALAALGAAEARGVTDVSGLVATILRIATPDGTLVVRLDDPEMKVDIDGGSLVITGPGIREVRLRTGQHRVRASRDGAPVLDELISISRGDTRLVTVSRETAPNPPAGEVPGTAIDPSKFTVTGGSVTLSMARPTPIEPARVLEGSQGGPAWAVAFSPDSGTLAAGGSDRVVRLFDAANGRLRRELPGHSSAIRHLHFAGGGKTLISSGLRDDLRAWDLVEGTPRTLESINLRRSGAFALSRDGSTLATVDPDDVLSLWDVATWRERLSFRTAPPARIGARPGAAVEVNALAFAPGGTSIAGAVKILRSRNGGRAVVWDASSGNVVATSPDRPSSAGGIAFAPDGRTVALASFDGTIALWDVQSRRVRATLMSLWTYAEPIAISADGSLLAAGHSNGIVSLWDLNTAEPLAIFRGHPSEVHAVAFSPDGGHLATAAADSTVKTWDVSAIRPNPKAKRLAR